MATSEGHGFLRHLPIRAGGGRASKLVEQRAVTQFSPTVQAYLEKIYSFLTTSLSASSPSNDGPPLGSFAEFQSWFESPSAAALAPPPNHDLSYPISNYYISSSHNTYLSGNQLYGAASGDAYRNVLLRGCRCLEIDVWDGEDDDTSVSSSDYEDLVQPEHREHKERRHESRRERANSAMTRLTDRVRDKAARMRSPSHSPRPENNNEQLSKTTSRPQAQHLDVLTPQQLKELKAEPRVYHGYTLTKDIPFRSVCHAIKDSAFEATDLPVIVSLEVHCSLDQQEVMVEIMKHVFKDHLVNISEDDESAVNSLPSPDQLRNKILIKVKWSPNSETGESNNPLEHVQTAESDPSGDAADQGKKKKASKILQALSELGVYTRAYSFKQFTQPEAKIPTHVFSLSEAKVENFHAHPEHGPALFEHNRDFLMRVFPSGLRVDSSNVEPCFLWRQGAQMVALNWQKLDKGMMLNEGMFAGEEGWVLKPEGFRGTCPRHNDGVAPTTDPGRRLLDLSVEILAAQQLPLPPKEDISHLPKMKPYVKIQLHIDTHGPPGQGPKDTSDKHAHPISKYNPRFPRRNSDDEEDEMARLLKRKSKPARSADPDFGGEVMEWKGIHDVVDELSFLRLKICDGHAIGRDNLIAWACIKLDRLKTGHRLIHLLDATGAPCNGILLVRVSKKLYA